MSRWRQHNTPPEPPPLLGVWREEDDRQPRVIQPPATRTVTSQLDFGTAAPGTINPPSGMVRRARDPRTGGADAPGTQLLAGRGRCEPEDPFVAAVGAEYFDMPEPDQPASVVPADYTVGIGALAKALGVTSARVRDLILRDKVLPEAPFRGKGIDHRLLSGKHGTTAPRRWPPELVTAFRNLARDEGLLGTNRPYATTNFKVRAFDLQARWLAEHPAAPAEGED